MLKQSQHFKARLSVRPITPGQLELTHADGRAVDHFSLPPPEYTELLLFARELALKTFDHSVLRVGLAADGRCFSLIPMHGLSKEWKSMMSPSTSFRTSYPGFLTTSSGPEQDDSTLRPLQQRILEHTTPFKPDYSFYGSPDDQNLFAKIVRNELPQWRIWENEAYVAGLTPFPNTPGATVVFPRRHLSSNVFSVEEHDYKEAIDAAYEVAGILKRALKVKRCVLWFEGFEIDYLHAKLCTCPFQNSGIGVHCKGQILCQKKRLWKRQKHLSTTRILGV
jgi:hypothetical protein